MDTLTIFSHRNLRYLFYFLLATLVVYFFNTLSLCYLNLKWVHHSPAIVEDIQPPVKKSMGSMSIEEYKSVWERNLFSVRVDEEKTVGEAELMAKIGNMALTSLNYSLVGTIINENGDSWAIIKENATNQEQKVTVGSTISGAKVTMILRNKVVLNINGKDELLVMGIEKIRAQQRQDENRGETEKQGEVSTYKISKDFISSSINNVTQIMSQVRVKPYVKDGKPQGFHISRIKEGSLVGNMGFKDNDIIKSINGQEIRTAEDIMGLYAAMKDSSFFSIGILRNNQPMTLNYKVR